MTPTNTEPAKQAPGAEPMKKHAAAQARKLLRKFASEAEKTRRAPDPEAVHDLRVSIRRVGQCLRIFGQFFPRGKRKRVRRRLKDIMQCAGEVRNRDIALELLASFGVPENAAVLRKLTGARAQAAGELSAILDRFHDRGSARKWRAQLGV